MTRIIYMPTHRNGAPTIRTTVQECMILRNLTGQDHLAVVVEHTAAPWTNAHRDELVNAAREKRVPALHLTVERWRDILDAILTEHTTDAADADRLRALLSPTDVAYSAGPNKAFLIAAALGVDTVHRRDSDHVPDHRQGCDVFPGILEASAIGRPLNEISPIINADGLTDSQGNERVYFVGSSMFGDPPHDRRDLLDIDEEFVAKVERLSSPDSSLEQLRTEVHGYFIAEPSVRYETDFYEIDRTGRTELGVSCLYRMFLELPEMPIRDTLGCDYFQKNLLYQLGRPVLFHSRKMRHVYDPSRATAVDVGSAVDYSLRDLRYLILWRIWSAHNRTIRATPGGFLRLDGSLRNDRYADSLAQAAATILPSTADIPACYSDIHRQAAQCTDGERAKRLRAVADAAHELGTGALDDVAQGVDDFVWLVRRWPALIRSAAAARSVVRGHIVRPYRV